MSDYSKDIIDTLLADFDNAANSDIKGAKLEELVTYLFSQVEGVNFHSSNVLDGKRAHEIDVIFGIDLRRSDLHFLGMPLFTECKNTDQPVGSAQVRWFIDKLNDRGLTCGILVSLCGISGGGDGTSSAHSEVEHGLIRGVRLLIMTREEIITLTNTDDLVKLLLEKYMQLIITRRVPNL